MKELNVSQLLGATVKADVLATLQGLRTTRTKDQEEFLVKLLHHHLILEHYLLLYIQLLLPALRCENAKIFRRFGDKLEALKHMNPSVDPFLIEGSQLVNEIRNTFAHHLERTEPPEEKIDKLHRLLKNRNAELADRDGKISKQDSLKSAWFLIDTVSGYICSFISGAIVSSASKKDKNAINILRKLLPQYKITD